MNVDAGSQKWQNGNVKVLIAIVKLFSQFYKFIEGPNSRLWLDYGLSSITETNS